MARFMRWDLDVALDLTVARLAALQRTWRRGLEAKAKAHAAARSGGTGARRRSLEEYTGAGSDDDSGDDDEE